MKPDEKYMRSNNSSNNQDNDLVLVPFDVEDPFNSISAGFIPVYFANPDLNNPSFINSGNTQFPQPLLPKVNTPNNLSNSSNANVSNNTSSYNPNAKYDLWASPNMNTNNSSNNNDNNLKSYNTSTPINSDTGDNNPNKYPSDISSNTLYSYNSSKIRFPDIQEIISTLNISYDEDNSITNRNDIDKKINNIYETIEKKYSEILTTLDRYKIPFPISKILVRKIIRISINYSNKEGE